MASHYRDAAKCLKAVDGGRTTLKTAAYKTQNPPRTVALVSEVRRHRKALETAIAATGPCRWVREEFEVATGRVVHQVEGEPPDTESRALPSVLKRLVRTLACGEALESGAGARRDQRTTHASCIR